MDRITKIKSMTPEEYLKFEEAAEVRHEYVDGQVYAMTGTTRGHNQICLNIAMKLHAHLRGSGCRTHMESVKVHVKAANCFYYPDIMVSCEQFIANDTFTTAPVLILEVLSRSTSHIDRREKRLNYGKLDSLREYVLISQNKIAVECYRKDADGGWTMEKLGRHDELVLHSMPGAPLHIPVAEIYHDLDLPSTVEESEEEYEFAE